MVRNARSHTVAGTLITLIHELSTLNEKFSIQLRKEITIKNVCFKVKSCMSNEERHNVVNKSLFSRISNYFRLTSEWYEIFNLWCIVVEYKPNTILYQDENVNYALLSHGIKCVVRTFSLKKFLLSRWNVASINIFTFKSSGTCLEWIYTSSFWSYLFYLPTIIYYRLTWQIAAYIRKWLFLLNSINKNYSSCLNQRSGDSPFCYCLQKSLTKFWSAPLL